PFAVDRMLAGRVPAALASLVFPLAWVAVEYANSALSPYGSWGVFAYTQMDHLPLAQLLSVTGLWGVSFLIAWFASIASRVALPRDEPGPPRGRGAFARAL